MDPYAEFRFALLPVRCAMGGGPAGCHRLLSRYQDAVDKGLDANMSWDEIFEQIKVTRHCCRTSIRGFSWHYNHNEFHPDYSLNSMNSENAVWSTSFSETPSYTIHTRCYRLDAIKGPVFAGYGRNANMSLKEVDAITESNNVADTDNEESDITITTEQLDEDDVLLDKHIKAITTLIEDSAFRIRQ